MGVKLKHKPNRWPNFQDRNIIFQSPNSWGIPGRSVTWGSVTLPNRNDPSPANHGAGIYIYLPTWLGDFVRVNVGKTIVKTTTQMRTMVLEYAHLQTCAIFGVNVGKYSVKFREWGCLAENKCFGKLVSSHVFCASWSCSIAELTYLSIWGPTSTTLNLPNIGAVFVGILDWSPYGIPATSHSPNVMSLLTRYCLYL